MVAARQDPRHDDTVPPVSLHDRSDTAVLARRWMDVSIGYHERLPRLEALQKEDRETALAAHRLAIANSGVLEILGGRIEDIAKAVDAQPPAPRRHPSIGDYEEEELTDHGNREKVPRGLIAQMRQRLDEREAREAEARAREMGAREALEKNKREQADAHEAREKASERFRKRWTFYILAFMTAMGIASASVTWAITHVSLEPRATPHEFVHQAQ